MDYPKIDLSNLKESHNDIRRGITAPENMGENLAYIIGVLSGDGHISKREYTIICGGNPKDEIEFYDKMIVNLFYKLFNIKIKAKHFSDGTYGVNFDSKLIHEFFTKSLGMPTGKKYDYLKIPLIIKQNEILKKHIRKAIEEIKENAFVGIRIPKRLFPKDYITKYGITNLWKYDLPDGWRLIYTLTSPNKVEVISVILEWFNHKEYEKRFRY